MKVDVEASEPRLNHALPGWAVDMMMFGLPACEAKDRTRLWTACMRIAMSAHMRGWSATEYSTAILAAKHSGLWRQLNTRPDGRPRSEKSAYNILWSAWECGVVNANDVGWRTKAEIAAHAVELAFRWADRITDGLDALDDAEAAVMGYVIAETERRGYLKVTCPGREVAEFAKTSHRTAARILSRLTERGLLIKHSSGRCGTGGRGRAAIYGLPDPDKVNTHPSPLPPRNPAGDLAAGPDHVDRVLLEPRTPTRGPYHDPATVENPSQGPRLNPSHAARVSDALSSSFPKPGTAGSAPGRLARLPRTAAGQLTVK